MSSAAERRARVKLARQLLEQSGSSIRRIAGEVELSAVTVSLYLRGNRRLAPETEARLLAYLEAAAARRTMHEHALRIGMHALLKQAEIRAAMRR